MGSHRRVQRPVRQVSRASWAARSGSGKTRASGTAATRSTRILAYGGGFGEVPNDHYFIHKGVVFSDRSPKPHYPEVKRAYQWIGFEAEDLAAGKVRIRNKYAVHQSRQVQRRVDHQPRMARSWSAARCARLDLAPGATESGRRAGYARNVPRPGAEYFLRSRSHRPRTSCGPRPDTRSPRRSSSCPRPRPPARRRVRHEAAETRRGRRARHRRAATASRVVFDKAEGAHLATRARRGTNAGGRRRPETAPLARRRTATTTSGPTTTGTSTAWTHLQSQGASPSRPSRPGRPPCGSRPPSRPRAATAVASRTRPSTPSTATARSPSKTA